MTRPPPNAVLADYAQWRRWRMQQPAVARRRRGIEVVRRYRNGETAEALAAEYGVDERTILRIVHYANVIRSRLRERHYDPTR